MLTSPFRSLGLLAAVLFASATGCGDGPICQSEATVIIASPQGPVIADLDPGTDGVQTDVEVRTTFPRDVELILTVRDSDGMTLATDTARTDADGNATFADVTIPATGAVLHVEGDAGQCGSDDDEVAVSIIGGGDCALEFVTAPVANDFYAPLPVWNADADSAPATPGFQGDTVVRARPGEQVKLFLSAPGLPEAEIGAGTASDTGTVVVATSAPEGQVNLRAECGVAAGVGARSSGVTSIFVDTVAPVCAMVDPTPGSSITPGLDVNDDLSDGIQLTLRGNASGGDGAGEAAAFTITGPGGSTTAVPGTDLSATGDSTADATFAPDSAPADYTVRFATEDHAGNRCEVDQAYRVVLAGCDITVVAPTGTVTTDADGDPSNGAQVDVQLSSPACAGRPIVSDCGNNDPGATLDGSGAGTLRVDVCDGVPCESSETCTVRVTSADGIETSAGVNLAFDNAAPNVALAVAAPLGVGCGGTVTPAQDLDAATAGVQIRMRVTAPSAVTRSIDVTSASGTVNVPVVGAGGEELVTIEPGANVMVGRAIDGAGNSGSSASCTVNLADIAVNFTGSPADGTVGAADGTVAGSSLTFAITGTVSVSGAAVSITIDGGAPIAATVTGTSWAVTVTLAARATPYAIVATASAPPRVGSATLPLTVDLTPPAAPSGLTALADTRQSIRLNFTSGGGAASYLVKFSTTALTDANFDTTGTAVTTAAPGAAGAAEVVRARPLRAGTPYWVGLAAVDAAGNRTVAQIAGPLTPDFDRSAVVAAPNASGTVAFGLSLVHGHFNDDAFEDVAVGAPYANVGALNAAGEVYIFLGSATGLATAPALTLQGTGADENLGASLAAVRWSSATRHDLAIGSPFADAGSGSVFVVNGGAALPTGTQPITVAQRRITPAVAVNWFTGSALGWQLASGDADGDGTDDLIATAVFGAGGASGGAVVFYGGTVPTGNVRISDLSATGSGSAVMRLFEDPTASGNLFGYYLAAVGRTGGVADITDDLVLGFAEDGLANADVIVYRPSGRPAAPGVSRDPFTVNRDVRIRLVTIDALLEFGSAIGSIADQNGDGARELVFGDFRYLSDIGVVVVVDGDTTGVGGVHTVDPATGAGALARWQPTTTATHFGMAIANNAGTRAPDVNGDGIEDLVVATRNPGTTQDALDIWFGPLPLTIGAPAPNHVITGPASFTGARPSIGGSPISAIWMGDVNADGLDDLCWADWNSASGDGGLQTLWDDGL